MANASVKPGRFVVPQNYVVEEVDDNAEPWLEDLEDDDDVEIWIMQAPPSVDLSKIQGMPIKLNGKTNFECAGFLGDTLESSVIPSDADKGLQCSLIAPSREDKKFHVVKKPFAGHILLTESFEIPSCIVPDETKFNRSDYPEKLKRNQQFGNHSIEDSDGLEASRRNESEFTQSSTDMHSSILEYNNMDVDDSPAADLVKSKKKKKKIKEEPVSPDLGETYNGDKSIYADLVKSKKKKKKIKEEPVSPDLSETYNGDKSIYEAVTFPVKQEEFDPY